MQYTGLSVFSLFDFFLYLWGMEIPAEVLKSAAGLVEMYGESFEYLGKSGDMDVYSFAFPEDELTGFPVVYLYKPGSPALAVSGMRAVKIVASFDVE